MVSHTVIAMNTTQKWPSRCLIPRYLVVEVALVSYPVTSVVFYHHTAVAILIIIVDHKDLGVWRWLKGVVVEYCSA